MRTIEESIKVMIKTVFDGMATRRRPFALILDPLSFLHFKQHAASTPAVYHDCTRSFAFQGLPVLVGEVTQPILTYHPDEASPLLWEFQKSLIQKDKAASAVEGE